MTNNVLDYLDETVKMYPEKTAFTDEYSDITFHDFQRKAKQVAMLVPKGIHRQPVVVFTKKSIKELICFIGVVYSGNFYVPIDPDSPMERVLKIIKTVSPRLIIAEKPYIDKIKEALETDIEVVDYDSHMGADINEYSLSCIRNTHLDTDPLYVLFTSGSTGMPKGVVISHKSVIDYTEWLADTFHFTTDTIFGNQAPFYFDNSILDIYSTLKAGASMCIIPEKLFMFTGKLLEYLEEKEINTIFWVPSALISVANADILQNYPLKMLKKILFCGEVMPNKQLNVWRKHFPDILYANLYGPTEITDVCTYYIVDREFRDEEPLPIGKPCKNTEILILNAQDKECSIGEAGELCVRGTCLSLGYYGDDGHTRDSFVQNPLNHKWTELIYRTGDIVKYNERKELLFLCRKDFQIKHLGHRIELGEIETAAYSMEEIKQCCALYDTGKKQIILFCSLSSPVIREKGVYAWLKKRLPQYMLPSVIVIKESLELNDNGKIDRTKLKKEIETER